LELFTWLAFFPVKVQVGRGGMKSVKGCGDFGEVAFGGLAFPVITVLPPSEFTRWKKKKKTKKEFFINGVGKKIC